MSRAAARCIVASQVRKVLVTPRSESDQSVPRGPSDDIVDRPGDSEQAQSPRRSHREHDELLARLQLQFERMPSGIVFDAQNRIIEWNTAAEEIFGWQREEVLGQEGPLILLGPAARPRLGEILRRVSAGDMSAHSLNENVTKDGRAITCDRLFQLPDAAKD